jgi:hypothetical protein
MSSTRSTALPPSSNFGVASGARLSIAQKIQIDASSTSDYPIVFVMRADPKPVSNVTLHISQGAIIRVADTNRPNFANFFEMQRRQPRIVKPKAISFTRATTDRLGKFSIGLPESTVR